MSAQRSPGAPQLRHSAHRALLSGERLEVVDGVRHCVHPACNARLSRYNPNPTCAAHGGWSDPPVRRRRPAADAS